MKKQFLRLNILLLLFVGLASCSSDDGGDDNISNTSLLFDKWWYIESSTTADLYFFSDGSYQQNIPFGGGIELFGTWEWVDEGNLIIKITYEPGSNSGIPDYICDIISIDSESMSLKYSFNDGESYTTELQYQDTEI